jgi:hypothetical protein
MAKNRAKLTGKGKNGRFYATPATVFDSPAYKSLSAHGFKLWHDLMTQYNGKNNGAICAILSQLEPRGWVRGSLYNALNELIAKGFLVRNFQGGLKQVGGKPSRYRFTHLAADAPEFDCPHTGPTSEYLKWEPKN